MNNPNSQPTQKVSSRKNSISHEGQARLVQNISTLKVQPPGQLQAKLTSVASVGSLASCPTISSHSGTNSN
jgi:hypothetical protein